MRKREVVLIFGSVTGSQDDIDDRVSLSVKDHERRGWEVVSATTSMAANHDLDKQMKYCTTIVFEKTPMG